MDRLLFIHIYDEICRTQGVPTEFASSVVWTKKISYSLQLYDLAYQTTAFPAGHLNARIGHISNFHMYCI
jgi:hypothetical protein